MTNIVGYEIIAPFDAEPYIRFFSPFYGCSLQDGSIEHGFNLNREGLINRIANQEAEGLDCSIEYRALAALNHVLRKKQ